jgi:nucleotidyltransferase/DNA polymerase involved in DNA repair
MKTILHIDMNAFFASVEQRADPALRGKAMAVVGSEHRGVILSPSYEARAFGVKTGMMYWEARQKCPEIVLVPADSAKYSYACERLIEIWKAFTPLIELFSIDEAFLDVTGCDEPLVIMRIAIRDLAARDRPHRSLASPNKLSRSSGRRWPVLTSPERR